MITLEYWCKTLLEVRGDKKFFYMCCVKAGMDKDRIRSLQQRLPQWPGILGREKYHSSAILVPLVTINGEEQLLFEKRAPHIKQGSEICFPGGHFDEKLYP